MVLPPPTDVTASLTLDARAALHLPSAQYREVALPEAGPDTRPYFPRHSPASAARRVTHDRASGTTTVMIESDTGRMEQGDHGLIWQDKRAATVSITRGDPSSYQAEDICIGRRERDGIVTEVTAHGWLRTTAFHWIASARIVATQDGAEVFRRDWSEDIPRDHM
jgi:hypothetical protein